MNKIFKALYYEHFSVLFAKTSKLISLLIHEILLDHQRDDTTLFFWDRKEENVLRGDLHHSRRLTWLVKKTRE